MSAKIVGVLGNYYGYSLPQIHLLGPWERKQSTYFTPSVASNCCGIHPDFRALDKFAPGRLPLYVHSNSSDTYSVGQNYRCFLRKYYGYNIYPKYTSLGLGSVKIARILRLRAGSECWVIHAAFRALDEFALGRFPLSLYANSNNTYTKSRQTF